MKIEVGIVPGGVTRKNFDRGARVIFLGLKFDKLLFFGLLKIRVIFGGLKYIYFGGLTGNLHYCFEVEIEVEIEVGIVPGGVTRKNFDRGARVIFLGLKFDKLLFFGLLKIRVIFGGLKYIYFGGLTGNLHYCFGLLKK